MKNRIFQAGFTIVELAVVIVVIAILATIVIVSYDGMQDNAEYVTLQGDMKLLDDAIQQHYSDTGSYPSTSNIWRGDYQKINDEFIPGLAPKYLAVTPQVKPHGANRPTFLYRSDGSEYKLLYILDAGKTLPAAHLENNPLLDPVRSDRAWGHWSPGGKNL